MPYICLAIPAVMGVGGGGHPRSGYPGDVAGASYVTSTTRWTPVGIARPDPVWLSRIGLATVGHMPTPVWLSRISWKYIYIYIYIKIFSCHVASLPVRNKVASDFEAQQLRNQEYYDRASGGCARIRVPRAGIYQLRKVLYIPTTVHCGISAHVRRIMASRARIYTRFARRHASWHPTMTHCGVSAMYVMP